MNRQYEIVNHLLLKSNYLNPTEEANLIEEVKKLWQDGILNSEFRQYLEKCVKGNPPSNIKPYLAQALLKQILSIVFIPPPMPVYMREYYEKKIKAVLDPPNAISVETMLDELKNDNLLNQAFAELFRYKLQEVCDDIGLLAADSYWQLCRDKLDETILQEIDFWLG